MSASDPLDERKRDARARGRAARCALDLDYCLDAAARLAERIATLPELASARVVLGYLATSEEIDPADALERLGTRGATIACPRIEAPGILGVHVVRPGDTLLPGPFGLSEPAADAERVEFERIDAVIVPGVAFDEEGRRIGHGGGYYDRLLPSLKGDCLLAGVCYDEQVARELPTAEHDVHMDLVITPTRVIRAR